MYCFEDLGIGATTTNVTLHACRNIGLSQLGIFGQEFDCLHDHSRGAIPALKGAFGQESFLHGVQLVPFGKALNGQDRLLLDVGERSDASSDAFAVDQDSAGAALAFATSVFGSGKLQILAQNIQQRALGIGSNGTGLPVNREGDCLFHTSGLGALSATLQGDSTIPGGVMEGGISRNPLIGTWLQPIRAHTLNGKTVSTVVTLDEKALKWLAIIVPAFTG